MNKILPIGLGILALATVFLLWKETNISSEIAALPTFGTTVPVTPSVFETYLASAEGTADTSLTIASGALRDGTSLSGYVCLTIDSNTSTLEYECGTASGTTVSGLTRGIDAVTGTSTVAALVFAHRRGADVKITDYPTLTILANQAAGREVYTNILNYISTPNFTNASSSAIASKGYVDSVAISGASNSSETVNGISQLATGVQAASSTLLGSTGARLVLPANLATDTPNTATRGSKVLMSTISGFLNQSWLDLTQLLTLTGGLTSTATTTLAASNVASNALKINTVPYQWPASQGGANSFLLNNGSGVLSWATGITKYNKNLTATSSLSLSSGYATTTSMVIAAGVLGSSSVITFAADGSSAAGASCVYTLQDPTGAFSYQVSLGAPTSATSWVSNISGLIFATSTAASQTGIIQATALNGGSVNSVKAGQAIAGETISNLNWANGLTLIAVLQASGGTCTLGDMMISINP